MDYITDAKKCFELTEKLENVIQEVCKKEGIETEYTRIVYADTDMEKQIKVPDIDLFDDIWGEICEIFTDETNFRVWIDLVRYIFFALEEIHHFKV